MVNVNVPISALPPAFTLGGADSFPVDQGGVTKRAEIAQLLTVGGFRPFVSIQHQLFPVSGTYIPSPGMLYCVVWVLGAGGGGGGVIGSSVGICIGGGGGSGGFVQGTFSALQIGSSQAVVVSSGGLGGVGAQNGGNAGNTTFGSFITAFGATGGFACNGLTTTPFGGAGGGTTGGDLFATGGGGQGGLISPSTSFLVPCGAGANSIWGQGGLGPSNYISGLVSNGRPPNGNGAGGSGGGATASAGSANGSAGTAGVVFIQEFCGPT